MIRYVAKRLLFMIPLLFGITIICFTVMHLAPGSPTDLQTQMNPRASVEMQQRLRTMYDLDKPNISDGSANWPSSTSGSPFRRTAVRSPTRFSSGCRSRSC
jgi:ABC-type dipeptide/oligopeptide/nickel transport system permease component